MMISGLLLLIVSS